MSGFIWGAGFEPTSKRDIDTAAKLLGLQSAMCVYDLGSGTGDVVMHLARNYDVKCVGIEIDPLKAWISRLRISRDKKIAKNIAIFRKNFLEVDLTKADAVYVFLSGGTNIMKKLEPKLALELKEGANVASYVHPFSAREPKSSIGDVLVYSFRK